MPGGYYRRRAYDQCLLYPGSSIPSSIVGLAAQCLICFSLPASGLGTSTILPIAFLLLIVGAQTIVCIRLPGVRFLLLLLIIKFL